MKFLKMMVINPVLLCQEQGGEKNMSEVPQFCMKLVLVSAVTGSQLAACLGGDRCQSFTDILANTDL